MKVKYDGFCLWGKITLVFSCRLVIVLKDKRLVGY